MSSGPASESAPAASNETASNETASIASASRVPAHPRIAYFGTPQVAVAPLLALIDAGSDVALVVSASDKRRGRGSSTSPSPVKAAALESGLVVTDRPDDIIGAGIDLGVVVAYGSLIRPHLLAVCPFVNIHVSDLPRWRGAAPVERAILAGDVSATVCVMALEEGLDTGGIYAAGSTRIADKTADELREELVSAGTELLLGLLANGFDEPARQLGVATYAAKIETAERQIDWTASATQINRLVRIGGAWTTVGGRRLKVHAAVVGGNNGVPATPPGQIGGTTVSTGEGVIELITVQPEGKGPMDAASWRRGANVAEGDLLGAPADKAVGAGNG